MEPLKMLIAFLALVPMNWGLSVASSGTATGTPSQSSQSSPPTASGYTKDTSAAATLGDLYRKSRQYRCVRCYEDSRYDDSDRYRYRGSTYTSGRTYDERPSDWYYPSERYDRYNDRVRYGGDYYDRYYFSYYWNRNDDRYNTRTYDRYDRDRYDGRYSYDRSPSENRGYGYDNRDRYYTNDYYRGGDRYGSRVGSSSYDRYGYDDRYYTRYDYRNYRPWDETYRGQSGFDNSGRGYYFANDRPNEYYEPQQYHPQSRPSGPSTPGPSYLPHEEYGRPSNSHGYPDSRPGSASSPSSSSLSSSSSSSSLASGSDYGNRPRDDGRGSDVGSGGGGGGGMGGGSTGPGGNRGVGGGADNNKNGYSGGGSWSYVNDREKDTGYKGGIRDKDNQSSAYGGAGGRGRPIGGSYLLDRDSNSVPEGSNMNNPGKPNDGHSMMDSPTASKLTSPSSTSTSNDRVAEKKDSN